MNDENPYSPPKADVARADVSRADTEKVVQGQKWIVNAVLIYFLAILLENFVSSYFALLGIVAYGMAVFGVVRIAKGFQYSTPLLVLLVVLTIVPLINLIVWLVLSTRATKYLRGQGYKVGLMGAKHLSDI